MVKKCNKNGKQISYTWMTRTTYRATSVDLIVCVNKNLMIQYALMDYRKESLLKNEHEALLSQYLTQWKWVGNKPFLKPLIFKATQNKHYFNNILSNNFNEIKVLYGLSIHGYCDLSQQLPIIKSLIIILFTTYHSFP